MQIIGRIDDRGEQEWKWKKRLVNLKETNDKVLWKKWEKERENARKKKRRRLQKEGKY